MLKQIATALVFMAACSLTATADVVVAVRDNDLMDTFYDRQTYPSRPDSVVNLRNDKLYEFLIFNEPTGGKYPYTYAYYGSGTRTLYSSSEADKSLATLTDGGVARITISGISVAGFDVKFLQFRADTANTGAGNVFANIAISTYDALGQLIQSYTSPSGVSTAGATFSTVFAYNDENYTSMFGDNVDSISIAMDVTVWREGGNSTIGDGNYWSGSFWILAEEKSSAAPEPASLLIFGLSIAGLAACRRKKR